METKKYAEVKMTEQMELLYKIAERAKFLADAPIDELRRCVSIGDNRSGIDGAARHRTRSDLLEEILVDEFLEDPLESTVGE